MMIKKLKEIEKAFAAITDLREVLERGDSMERLAMKAKALERQVAGLEKRRSELDQQVASLDHIYAGREKALSLRQKERMDYLEKTFDEKSKNVHDHGVQLDASLAKFERESAERIAAMKREEQEAREKVVKAERAVSRMAERLSA